MTIIELSPHLLPREPSTVGEAVAIALQADGVDVRVGTRVERVQLAGSSYLVELSDGTQLEGDRVLVATGRRPRVDDIGLETVGIEANPRGIAVDDQLSAAPGIWAIGDVTGLWQLTHVGEYQGRVAASNILGTPRTADYQAVPRVVYCYPQAASVGAAEGPYVSTVQLSGVPRTSTYLRSYDTQPGFLTLVSDGDVLIGAYAVGPEAGEWLQQATLAIRAKVPLPVLLDVIQPFPTFSEAFLHALRDLAAQLGRQS